MINGSSSVFKVLTDCPTGGALKSSFGATGKSDGTLEFLLGATGKSSLLNEEVASFLVVVGEEERPRAVPMSSEALAE